MPASIGGASNHSACASSVAVWARRSEFQIIESVKYYFDQLETIGSPNYVPTKDDILYTRVRTSGVVTEKYDIESTPFEMYDVGGQKNERRVV